MVNVCLVVEIFFSSLVSQKLQGRSCGGNLVPCVLVIEVAPASSKLPAGDVVLRQGSVTGVILVGRSDSLGFHSVTRLVGF